MGTKLLGFSKGMGSGALKGSTHLNPKPTESYSFFRTLFIFVHLGRGFLSIGFHFQFTLKVSFLGDMSSSSHKQEAPEKKNGALLSTVLLVSPPPPP